MKYNLLIAFFCFTSSLFSQYDIEEVENDTIQKETPSPFELKQKIYVGGDFSLRFGWQTYVYLAPLIGYDITPKFSAGFSSMYQLFRIKYNNGATVSDHVFGSGIFIRYRPIQQIILHSELNLYNTVDYTVLFGDRINVPAFMLGGGYAGSMGDRSYYNIMIMYDFIQNENMPLPAFIAPPFYLKFGVVWYLG